MNLSRYTVLFDACVLYPAPLRDLLVQMSTTELFRAKWTDDIHEEWVRSLVANRPELDRARLDQTRHQMNDAVLDCLVAGYEDLIPALVLPDPDDRHVLAAAIHCGADAIVTFNLRDFPPAVMLKYELEVLHPDDFIQHQFHLDQAALVVSAQRCRSRLKAPPISASDYLGTLARQSLAKTVAELQPFVAVI